ncbi:hypothetical protein Q6D67_14855 [Haliea sp. E1-2-M8]|uniref:hypothetical protein n=1 Tax=Haliea sp. E1-2-M8 TaxID=3064706 RepID=UPI00272206F9|nr:hypothetical protein [Haliea sp. E1-2-M8]MDO8862987.1 hypothetical protein [Haliea sp. E1-2-M8]
MGLLDTHGEQYPGKVSAEFETRESAESVIAQLAADSGLSQSRVELVVPGDQRLGSKVEPESRGIARTAVKSHLVLGLAFLVLGLAAAWLLVTFGPPLTRSSPVMVFIVLGFFPPLVGLMLAGAITLRPDHEPLISSTRQAAESGRWTVVVHCTEEEQKQRARELLDVRAETL